MREQIRVAAGEPLSVTQKDIAITGHAIECRVNAEDPDRDFAPSPGTIEAINIPGGPGIRVDTHAYSQYVIPAYYDSLIAKLVAHGPDRARAVERMLRALDEFIVEGVNTTIPFHRKAVGSDLVRSGNFDTGFVEQLANPEASRNTAEKKNLSGVHT